MVTARGSPDTGMGCAVGVDVGLGVDVGVGVAVFVAVGESVGLEVGRTSIVAANAGRLVASVATSWLARPCFSTRQPVNTTSAIIVTNNRRIAQDHSPTYQIWAVSCITRR